MPKDQLVLTEQEKYFKELIDLNVKKIGQNDFRLTKRQENIFVKKVMTNPRKFINEQDMFTFLVNKLRKSPLESLNSEEIQEIRDALMNFLEPFIGRKYDLENLDELEEINTFVRTYFLKFIEFTAIDIDTKCVQFLVNHWDFVKFVDYNYHLVRYMVEYTYLLDPPDKELAKQLDDLLPQMLTDITFIQKNYRRNDLLRFILRYQISLKIGDRAQEEHIPSQILHFIDRQFEIYYDAVEKSFKPDDQMYLVCKERLLSELTLLTHLQMNVPEIFNNVCKLFDLFKERCELNPRDIEIWHKYFDSVDMNLKATQYKKQLENMLNDCFDKLEPDLIRQYLIQLLKVAKKSVIYTTKKNNPIIDKTLKLGGDAMLQDWTPEEALWFFRSLLLVGIQKGMVDKIEIIVQEYLLNDFPNYSKKPELLLTYLRAVSHRKKQSKISVSNSIKILDMYFDQILSIDHADGALRRALYTIEDQFQKNYDEQREEFKAFLDKRREWLYQEMRDEEMEMKNDEELDTSLRSKLRSGV
eukprot:403360616